ncbi:MAG: GAF domain-containing protein [Candidatus Omnitrophica bacterium]|nr:GAF domain-containing protein [Candidatus Omnitrophota bacterium]
MDILYKLPLAYYVYSSLVNFIVCTAITLGVFLKNPKSPLVRLFCVFTSELSIWSLLYVAWLVSHDRAQGELWVRTVMILVALMPASFLHFISELTQRKLPRWLHVLNYCIGFAFASMVYSPLFARYHTPPFLVFPVWPIAGPLFYLHVLHFGANISYAHYVMYRVLQVETGILRTKILAVFWGTFIAVITGVTNFLPWFRIPAPPIFPLFVSLFVIVYAYAIVRHQLLDIEVIIKRTLVFAGLVASVVGVVSLVAVVSQDVLIRFIAIPKWLSNVLAAGIIAGVYGPLRNWLVNVTERYLFQKRYDYKELLKRFMEEVLVGIRDLKQLAQLTVHRLTETVKLDTCSLLLRNPDTRDYERLATQGTNGQALVLHADEPFVTFLRKTHEPIGMDGPLGKVRFPEAVTARLHQLNARLCLPLHVHEELIGVLCLGKKKSDEEFTQDDVDILRTLAGTLAIAMANAQQAVELAKTQAEAAQKEKLAVIGTLSAGINHEICNPLGIVKAQCEAFLLDQEDGILIGKSSQELLERTSNIMRVSLKQIDRATAITQKLSNFAKPVKEPTTQPVSVAQEVDEVLFLVRHDLKLEKIDVETAIQPDLPAIVADRRQLQEVLFNIVRNAGQAITPPGTITIRASQYEGAVRITIADTGSGIPPDQLDKIYDPFFTTKEPGKGTGLGLFIVRQIVERNRGRISVESTVGKGTTFFLDFPVTKQIAAVSG